MPKSCAKCRFCIHKTEVTGLCLALAIKVVPFQEVYIQPETALGNERNKHCPLQEVKE